MTTIKLKNGSGAPTAGDLVQGEPALDLTNKRLYTEDSGGTVIEVGTNPGASGAVTLNHSGSAKLATTSTGITVDGDATLQGSGGQSLVLRNTNTAIVDGDSFGTVDFYGDDSSTGASGVRAQIEANQVSSFGAAELTFRTADGSATTLYDRFNIANTGDISFYNDAGTSQDFFWDASTSRLGLGSASPAHELHITSDSPQLRLQDSDGTNTYGDMQFNGTALALITRGGASSHGVMRFRSTNGTDTLDRLEILSNGDVVFYDDAGASGGRWDASAKSLGIGTVSPAVALDVQDSGDATIRILSTGTGVSDDTILRSQIGGTTASNYLYFGDADDNNSGQIRYVHSDDSMRFHAGATTERLRLYSTASIFYNGGTEIGRFHSNNYFGIGTSSPAEELHINASVPTIRLQDSDGTGTYSNILHSNGLLFLYARNGSSYGTFNFVGDNGTSQDTFSQITENSIQQFNSSAWYIRNRVDGGSLNFGVETSAGSLYYPIQMVGSSNIIKFENANGEMARFTTNGRLGIGTTSPSSVLHAQDTNAVVRSEGTGGYGSFYAIGSGTNSAHLFMGNAGGEKGRITTTDDGSIRFSNTTSATERMRVDSSGNLLVGKTTSGIGTVGHELGATGYAYHTRDGGSALDLNRKTSDGKIAKFYKDGAEVGSISVTASATAYNTSSDQRLKDNIVDAPSASDDIDAIQVRSFDWKADGSHQKYGMVAQELNTVAPEAVTEGETEEDMMSVDYSKLVPMLIKEIQSLRARVAQLEGAN